MGLFDELAGKAQNMFGAAGGEGSGVMKDIMDMLSNSDSGGLSGLVQSFKDKGLGDVVSSWVSTGENQSVNADQVKEALGNETIQNLAEKAGMSSTDVSSILAQNLPGLIDKLTPDGVVPGRGFAGKGA